MMLLDIAESSSVRSLDLELGSSQLKFLENIFCGQWCGFPLVLIQMNTYTGMCVCGHTASYPHFRAMKSRNPRLVSKLSISVSLATVKLNSAIRVSASHTARSTLIEGETRSCVWGV